MNTWLLLGGEFAPPACAPSADAAVIAVDGGIRHAEKLGITPALWIGDFDSADNALQEQYAQVPRLAFPADKGQTDFELALAHVNAQYQQGCVHIIGAGGGEADHAFANLHVLPQSPLPCVLWQKNAVIVAGRGAFALRFSAKKGSKVSVFACEVVRGVEMRGLRWTVESGTLQPFCAFAARNEMTAAQAEIGWQSGFGLVFLPRDAHGLEVSARLMS